MFLLNGYQQKALEDLDKFLYSKSKKIYLLEGFAGTGKTTIITSLFSSKKFFNKEIALSATTNKAVSVLQNMFGKTYEHVDFKTIHKLCKIKRQISSNGDITFNLNESPAMKAKNQKTIYNYDIIIIDECSMISSNIMELLIKLSKRIRGKIIFVGDKYQLPPVNEEMSEVFKLPVDKSVLSKIVRCNDNVITFAARIRDSIDTGKNIATKGCKGDDFVTFKDSKLWLDDYIKHFEVDANNILLAYTNSRCNEINKYIRKTIYGSKAKQTFITNEIIVFNNFYKVNNLQLHPLNNDILAITPIQDSEAIKEANENSVVFYTSHKAIVASCQEIKLMIPSFPLEALFNINKKLDMNFSSVKPNTFKESQDCPICFDTIRDIDMIETGCKHIFCQKCIKIWLEQNDLCPYCRMSIVDKKIVFNDDEHLTKLINEFKELSTNQVYNVWRMEIVSGKRSGVIFVPTTLDKLTLEIHIKQLKTSILKIKDHLCKKSNISGRKLFIINRLWEYFYYSFIDIFADISYGYCITVHKSQGSTFDNVYVDSKNILSFKNKDTLNCLYTAVTRASKVLKLLV
jgi:hypothetical protein